MLTPSPVQLNLAPSTNARKVEKPYLDKKTTKNTPFNSTKGKAVAQQYTFDAHPLNVEPVVVPHGWTWCTHQKQLEEMVEDKLHQLHDTVGSSCVMFGSSQLRSWLRRSAHPSVYSSNSELIDDTRFPFTIQRCLLIWGFDNNLDQTSAEGFASDRYSELFGKSVTGRDNNFTSSSQLTQHNPGGVYGVVCAGHITKDNFKPKRAACKKWFNTYREQNPTARITQPLDVWKSNYADNLAAMFEPHPKDNAQQVCGNLKKSHITFQRQLDSHIRHVDEANSETY
jgi:hypothetical protein